MSSPLLSIIVPSFNSKEHYKTCLKSLLSINYPNFEIIVVDGGSTDGSIEEIKKISQKNPKLRIVQALKRADIPASRNMGIEVAQGELIAFFDMDMEVTKSWPNELIKVLLSSKDNAAVLPKVLDFHQRNVIQTVGGRIIPYSAWVFVRGYGEVDKGQYDFQAEISINAAGAIVKKDAARFIGGFDESLGAYDDLDFGWRLWIAGYKSFFVPEAVIYHWTIKPSHARHAGSSNLEKEFQQASVLRMMIKNLQGYNLMKYLPLALLINILRILINILRGNFQPLLGLIKAYFLIIIELPKILKQRSYVQRIRKFSDQRLFGSAFVSDNFLKAYQNVFAKNLEVSKTWHMKGVLKTN